ncbi:MAG: M48 family metallopeptidase [Firmicutes bacterium]|nr:M48 family metallopeptidase [Bacillota bacterium]
MSGEKQPYSYEIIRSGRRSLCLEISDDMRILVRAPRQISPEAVEQFVCKHRKWLDKHLPLQQQRQAFQAAIDSQEQTLRQRAQEEIPPLVRRYQAQMGVEAAGIRITGAAKRFGSCSAVNRLCFSWRLMAYPQAAIEYVVVHELCHIVHKNHGPAFYALLASVLPDHRSRERLLRF